MTVMERVGVVIVIPGRSCGESQEIICSSRKPKDGESQEFQRCWNLPLYIASVEGVNSYGLT